MCSATWVASRSHCRVHFISPAEQPPAMTDPEFFVHISPNGDYVSSEFFRETANRAAAAGFDGILAGDHVVLPGAIPDEYPYSETGEYWSTSSDDSYEVFQTLSYLAGHTEDLVFGTNVAVAPYRHPVLLAKNALTAAALSNGRFELGIGVGWLRTEFEVLDVPFAERGSRTDEFLRLFERVLDDGELAFDGPHHTFQETGFHPVPDGNLPVWIGGDSGATFRRVAEFGDGWTAARLDPSALADRYARLLDAWHDYDRDGEPAVALMDRCRLDGTDSHGGSPFVGAAEDVRTAVGDYVDRGVDRIVIVVDDEFEHLDRFGAEVVGAV
ncbi:MAG: TIGR03619 family F420-dependent LLM class oxidoreductase [Salinirussus sp.]